MLISDMPLQRKGIKDKKLYEEIYANHMEKHLDIAVDAVRNINEKWVEVEKRLASEW
jgi:AMP nucleosidase